jgi:hypothetical protein
MTLAPMGVIVLSNIDTPALMAREKCPKAEPARTLMHIFLSLLPTAEIGG